MDTNFLIKKGMPVKFILEFRESINKNNFATVQVFYNDIKIGNPLTDNSYEDDGYRYHDAIHLAFASILGWSPITTYLFAKFNIINKDCNNNKILREREEQISLFIFSYYKKNKNSFKDNLDNSFKEILFHLIKNLDIQYKEEKDWLQAIKISLSIQEKLCLNKGGYVKIDLCNKTLNFSSYKPKESFNKNKKFK